MSDDLDKMLRFIRRFERELESEQDFHGAGVVGQLVERIETEFTEDADLECSCLDDEVDELCPFHGAPA